VLGGGVLGVVGMLGMPPPPLVVVDPNASTVIVPVGVAIVDVWFFQ
jgi:hypothetical protein